MKTNAISRLKPVPTLFARQLDRLSRRNVGAGRNGLPQGIAVTCALKRDAVTCVGVKHRTQLSVSNTHGGCIDRVDLSNFPICIGRVHRSMETGQNASTVKRSIDASHPDQIQTISSFACSKNRYGHLMAPLEAIRKTYGNPVKGRLMAYSRTYLI
jgi:hypothetical protein